MSGRQVLDHCWVDPFPFFSPTSPGVVYSSVDKVNPLCYS